MATTSWKKAKSGAWEDAKNWTGGVPGQDDVAQIAAQGAYTVTLSSKQTVAELDIGAFATLKEEKGGALTTGKIVLDEAKLVLNNANPGLTGEIDATASTIVVGRQGALGNAAIHLAAGGILDSTVSTTLVNDIKLGDQSGGAAAAIMAANGRVLAIAGDFDEENGDAASLTFGAKTKTGEIDLAFSHVDFHPATISVDIAGGILKIVNSSTAEILEADASTSIEKGASLVLGTDFFGEIFNIFDIGQGGKVVMAGHTLDIVGTNDGLITNSGSLAKLGIDDLTGSGKITGDIEVGASGSHTITNAIELTGQGSFQFSNNGEQDNLDLVAALTIAAQGRLSIAANCNLTLEASAKIACPVDVEGGLYFDSGDGKATVSGDISGGGEVGVENGFVKLSGDIKITDDLFVSGGTLEVVAANSGFSAAVGIQGGTLLLDDGAGLGNGVVHVLGGILSLGANPAMTGAIEFQDFGGTILARADASLGNALSYFQVGGGVLAAATGHTLMLTGSVDVENDGSIVFGASGDTGTIVLAPASGNFSGEQGTYTVEVAAGTLKIGSTSGSFEVNDAGHVTVDTGGTFDVGGFNLVAATLAGGGAITTSAGGSLTVEGGTFSGAIGGGLLIFTVNSVTLAGAGSFTTLEIGNGTTTLGGQASEHVLMDGDPATLALTATAHLAGSIAAFGAGDKLDLQGLAYQASGAGATSATFDVASHHLTVTAAGQSIVLTLDGSYATGNFFVSNDGSGHTLVGYQSVGAPPPHASPPAHAFTFPYPAAHPDLLHAVPLLAPHDPHLAVFA